MHQLLVHPKCGAFEAKITELDYKLAIAVKALQKISEEMREVGLYLEPTYEAQLAIEALSQISQLGGHPSMKE